MLQTSSDDLLLPSYQDEALVDNLLSDGDGGGTSLSMAKALLPQEEFFSPPLNPSVCTIRYKTELCTSYSSTTFCKYGKYCQFAHGLHELRVPFRHPKYKTELCRNYYATGHCYYGLRCLFVHNPTEQRPNIHRRRNVPCWHFCSSGFCPFGTRCLFKHFKGRDVDNSQKLNEVETPPAASPQLPPQAKDWKLQGTECRTFSSFGFCVYGTRCVFQHCLPCKVKNSDQSDRMPNSSTFSSPSTSPLATPPAEATADNAVTFPSQLLTELLLPLALHLKGSDQGQ